MKRRHGFTLIELLVVVAIIALLVSILLPALGRARDLTRTSVCMANMRGCGSAMAVYQAEQNGLFIDLFAYNYDGRAPGYDRSWWSYLFAKDYLTTLDVIWCPQFDIGKCSTPDTYDWYTNYGAPGSWVRIGDEGWSNTTTAATSSYGYFWGGPHISWRNGWPYDEMIDVDKVIRAAGEEAWLFDIVKGGAGVFPWMTAIGATFEEWTAEMPSDYSDPAGYVLREHMASPIGEPGSDMRWSDISLRHGVALNALFFDSHVEKVDGRRMWAMQTNATGEGSVDCIWDGF